MEGVDSILAAGKYPAKAHAAKVVAHLKNETPANIGGVIYLEGQKTRMQEDSDHETPFRYTLYSVSTSTSHCSLMISTDKDVTSSIYPAVLCRTVTWHTISMMII